jgi:hypothetical protein
MGSISAIIILALLGTPISVGLAWWIWSLRDRSAAYEKSRTGLLLIGLCAASLNGLMYFSWLAFRLTAGGTAMVWQIKGACTGVGVFLVVLALISAVFGKGGSRELLALGAVLGLLLWVPVAVL